MKKCVLWGVVGVFLLASWALPNAGAQSLGEIARKIRAEKQNAPKATRVYTNDNMPKQGGLSMTTTPEAPAAAAAGKEAAGKEAGEGKEAAGKEPEKKSQAEEEKEWRAKFAKLREELKYEEKKLDVLQRELNLSQMQNYSDPNVAMREQFQRTEINAKTKEIEAQKQAVDRVKQSITALEDELRSKNLPSGWAQ